jgi:hemerythrin-like domain-containing protein
VTTEVDQITIFHRPIRREFTVLGETVAAVPPDDLEAARVVASHATMMLGLLQEHLRFEDALWPVLRRHTRIYAELIAAMEARHAAIAALTVPVERGLLEYAVRPAGTIRDRLVDNLDRLSVELRDHLDLEESEILPLVTERFTAAESNWRHVTFDCRPRDLRPSMLRAGALLEEATVGERRGLMRRMPVPLRVVYRLVGTRMYAARVGGVRDLLDEVPRGRRRARWRAAVRPRRSVP